MLSLSAAKDGVILPSEEDRKRILTQMKVRTTLKGDNSWIQQKRSDSEEEQNHGMLHSPQRTRATAERSPVSQRTLSPNHRTISTEQSSQGEPQSPPALKSPSKKSPTPTAPSGYLIRGVFMKTVDKTSPSNTMSNGSPKSAKSASLPRFSQGYKMTTDEYKKLAPYNIKRELSDPGEVEHYVSPDEQKKRTEAASSLLRRTASRERSYVLSAAKKSNGMASQEALPFVAKRIVEEDDMGPRSRSQTVPASAWFHSRGKSNTNGEKRSMGATAWNESKMADAAFSASVDTSTSRRSQASQPYEERSSALNPLGSPMASEKHDRNFNATTGTETRRVLFSDDSWEGGKLRGGIDSQPSDVPYIVISPEGKPKNSRSTSHDKNKVADSTVETHHRPEMGKSLQETEFGSRRPVLDHKVESGPREFKYRSPGSQVTEFSEHEPDTSKAHTFTRENRDALPGARDDVPAHLDNDENLDSKRTLSGFETKTTQEAACEAPSDNEYKKVEAYLAKSGSWSSESSVSTTGTQNEPLRSSRRDESDLETARSSSLSTESGIATPESQRGEPGSDSDPASRAYYPFRDGPMSGSPRSHRMPFYQDTCDPESKSKGLLFVKESVNSTELSSSPRYNSRSLVDLSELEKLSRSSSSYLNSSPPKRTPEDLCTYCGREIRNCAKITINNLRICCHDYCFRCGICHKPMGDLLDKIFIHRDIVHCDKCYEKLF
ncbi:zinc finger protein 185 isoform X1 [Pogona vitticeps]